MSDLVPLTELESINKVLAAGSYGPISTLLNIDDILEAQMAQQKLHEISRRVQTRGWSWNRDEEFEIQPDTNDNILIPGSALRMTVSPIESYRKTYVQREGKMYDYLNQTFTITDPCRFDIVWFLAFESLVDVARAYITIKACREFAVQETGDAVTAGYTQREEDEAYRALRRHETIMIKPNTGYDNMTSLRVNLRRNYR